MNDTDNDNSSNDIDDDSKSDDTEDTSDPDTETVTQSSSRSGLRSKRIQQNLPSKFLDNSMAKYASSNVQYNDAVPLRLQSPRTYAQAAASLPATRPIPETVADLGTIKQKENIRAQIFYFTT